MQKGKGGLWEGRAWFLGTRGSLLWLAFRVYIGKIKAITCKN